LFPDVNNRIYTVLLLSRRTDDDDDPFRRRPLRRRSPFDIFRNDNNDINSILKNLEEIFSEVFHSSWREDSDFPQPFVWGLSFNRDSEGNTKIEKFGNLRDRSGSPRVDNSIREPLTDVMIEDEQIRIIIEIPGVEKENINISSTSSYFKLKANAPGREYIKEIDLPVKVKPETAKAKFKNGVLEVVFQKKILEEPSTRINID